KAAAPPWKTRAGPLGSVLASVGLAAEEGRNIELIVLAGIMHRRVAAMRVEAMRRGPARVFRDGLRRTAFGMPGAGTLRRTLILQRVGEAARGDGGRQAHLGAGARPAPAVAWAPKAALRCQPAGRGRPRPGA